MTWFSKTIITKKRSEEANKDYADKIKRVIIKSPFIVRKI